METKINNIGKEDVKKSANSEIDYVSDCSYEEKNITKHYNMDSLFYCIFVLQEYNPSNITWAEYIG